jgi:hypothetical protein
MELIIEKANDGMLWGRVEVPEGEFQPVTVGKTTQEVIDNVISLISDHQNTDGDDVKYFANVNMQKPLFNISYDIQTLFSEFSFLKTTLIAEEAGINAGLMRQYSSGVKHPSPKQAQRIEDVIHKLAERMLAVSLV